MADFLQRDAMFEASLILQDDRFTRWTLPVLNLFINGALREILLHKPNAFATTVNLTLEAGARQQMPDQYPTLLRIIRNVVPETPSALAGNAITQITLVSRQMMDAIDPYWSDPNFTKPSARVKHFMFDVAQPDHFYVYPPNNGAGVVEAIVAAEPARIGAPASGQTLLDSWSAVVPIKESYRQAVVDYMLFRAYSMDLAIPGSAQRAQMHRAAFAEALGIKYSRESLASPKTTYAAPAVDGGAA